MRRFWKFLSAAFDSLAQRVALEEHFDAVLSPSRIYIRGNVPVVY